MDDFYYHLPWTYLSKYFLSQCLFFYRINKFFDNLNEKFKKAREILGNLGTKLADYINRLFDGIDWSKLGQTIGNGLNAIINFFKNFY